MSSKNATSAENQQERLKTIGWIVGFVDGEGAFTVSINKNHTSKLGWQVFPEFVVTQGESSKDVLVMMRDFFLCGHVYINKRYDNHWEDLYRYCVRSISDLNNVIVPFFKAHPLKTKKRKDFEYFCIQMQHINNREHLHMEGIRKIAHVAMKMNRRKQPKFLGSSQTTRQALDERKST